MAYKDKTKQREQSAAHYQRNRGRLIAEAKEKNIADRIRNRAYIDAYLATHPCVDCGESDPVVLEFDHVRGIKRKDLSHMRTQGYSLKAIDEEIAKCDVRCANCHRRITRQRECNISDSNREPKH